MEKITKRGFSLRQRRFVKLFTVGYFFIAFVEIIAEYFRDTTLVYATKPLLMPLLILLYWSTSRRFDYLYVFAILFSWVANIFFVSTLFQSIMIGAFFFIFQRLLIIYIVLKYIKLPSIFPMIVGCIPFLFIYFYLVCLTHDKIGDGLIIFVVQCVLISFLGGLAVGNYIFRSNRANKLLLLSIMFFAITQFVFVLRLYYTESNVFQPIAMILFVAAQYLFYRFLLLAEKKKAGFEIIGGSRV